VPIALFLSMLVMLTGITASLVFQKEVRKLQRKNGAIDSVSGEFVDTRGKNFLYSQVDYTPDEKLINKETVETAMIRTCRAVSTIAHDAGCQDWNKASYIWSYVGSIQGTGSLDLASSGSTDVLFACDKNAEFARGLFQNSLPSSFVVGRGYYYDFTNMDDKNSDPCGYIDIVRY